MLRPITPVPIQPTVSFILPEGLVLEIALQEVEYSKREESCLPVFRGMRGAWQSGWKERARTERWRRRQGGPLLVYPLAPVLPDAGRDDQSGGEEGRVAECRD